ncbi:hypothetical protein C8J57DRAFT_1224138 [Mycena rebaudengoi]|nr:hypothetical protein C8J57DRAFT_1224138 [Mycena rebaudengoi]
MPWPNKRPNQINDRLLQLGPLLHLLCQFPSLFFVLSSLQLLQNYLAHPMQTIGDRPNAKTSSADCTMSLALSEALKADHGFNGESRAIRDLVEILSEYDPMTRNYLQFVTGVQGKLPLVLRS